MALCPNRVASAAPRSLSASLAASVLGKLSPGSSYNAVSAASIVTLSSDKDSRVLRRLTPRLSSYKHPLACGSPPWQAYSASAAPAVSPACCPEGAAAAEDRKGRTPGRSSGAATRWRLFDSTAPLESGHLSAGSPKAELSSWACRCWWPLCCATGSLAAAGSAVEPERASGCSPGSRACTVSPGTASGSPLRMGCSSCCTLCMLPTTSAVSSAPLAGWPLLPCSWLRSLEYSERTWACQSDAERSSCPCTCGSSDEGACPMRTAPRTF
mmetsp:Transcript_53924/g.139339  ORF Transcript_53924/g.139339 Transcript_53924/m.139339 type:complete len:269 (-) Transcript_53924:2-808(-)